MQKYSLLLYFLAVFFAIVAAAMAEMLYRKKRDDNDEVPSYLVQRGGSDRPVITIERYQPRRGAPRDLK